MPTPILPSFTFNHIKKWIFGNIATPPIVPITKNLEAVPPKTNIGMYFWFIKESGYNEINKKVQIKSILPRIEDDNGNHLVYVGTSGTGKKGGGFLRQRLEWHISQKHTCSTVCNVALSSLRAGIGALISDDLIYFPNSITLIPSTATKINSVFEEHFLVYWIVYPANNVTQLDSDEKLIIQKVNPLFNFKHNPNAKKSGESTAKYRKRRIDVYKQTMLNCNCNPTNKNQKKQHKLPKPPNLTDGQIEGNGFEECLEKLSKKYSNKISFSVRADESIHEVINARTDLPGGLCEIIMYDSNYSFFYGNKPRKTGKKKQNIYTYFNAPDTNKNNSKRWELVQSEMKERNIQEISVDVYH